MTTATWTVRIGKNKRYYVALRGSRLRYPADDRLHAHRLTSALNRGADLFGAKRLAMAMLRDAGK